MLKFSYVIYQENEMIHLFFFFEFLDFASTSDGLQKPQCVVCFEVLAHTSFEPCMLKRHLETKRPELVDKNL